MQAVITLSGTKTAKKPIAAAMMPVLEIHKGRWTKSRSPLAKVTAATMDPI